jgi:hypothetical protein
MSQGRDSEHDRLRRLLVRLVRYGADPDWLIEEADELRSLNVVAEASDGVSDDQRVAAFSAAVDEAITRVSGADRRLLRWLVGSSTAGRSLEERRQLGQRTSPSHTPPTAPKPAARRDARPECPTVPVPTFFPAACSSAPRHRRSSASPGASSYQRDRSSFITATATLRVWFATRTRPSSRWSLCAGWFGLSPRLAGWCSTRSPAVDNRSGGGCGEPDIFGT